MFLNQPALPTRDSGEGGSYGTDGEQGVGKGGSAGNDVGDGRVRGGGLGSSSCSLRAGCMTR